MIRLSVLDQSPVSFGKSPADAIRETIELAKTTERLGYHRYWLSEHHNTPGLAGSTPEVLIAYVASQTAKIRIGSGGVLLNHYNPYKVAEIFRMLHTLFPGRIDLGIGRAPGGDYSTTQVLQAGNSFDVDLFPQKLEELFGFLHDSFPSDHPYAEIKAMPTGSGAPDIWLLGSSSQSADYAAQLGTAFSFAHFINGYGGPGVVHYYLNNFKPSSFQKEPQANAAIFVLCAETEEKVHQLVATMDLRLLRIEQGKRGTVPTVEEALSYPYSPWERERVEVNRRRMIVGTPEEVKSKLLDLSQRYEVEELMVVTITNDFQDRLRSYELLADAFGLSKAGYDNKPSPQ